MNNQKITIVFLFVFVISFASVSGVVGAVCGNAVVEFGEACDNGGNNGAWPKACSLSCILNSCSTSDSDSDSFPDSSDNCPTVWNPDQKNTDKELQLADTTAPFFIGDGLGDVCDPDVDNDGFSNDAELEIGTAPSYPCGNLGWPADLASGGTSTNKVTITDITSFLAPTRIFNTNLGPFTRRWDLVPGKGSFSTDINIQDLTNLITLAPPMLGGARAFNGPECPISPSPIKSCYDSDGGLNYGVAGVNAGVNITSTGPGVFFITDFCLESYIIEGYCSGSNLANVSQTFYGQYPPGTPLISHLCPNGCSAGRCL
ncbi:MAG: thrombospondin type 3 repeat-containing protein [Candidatus Poribacteria bacterium]